MSDRIRWPVAVYFDTSILWKLPLDLSNPDLVELQNFARELRIGLFVPDVAVKEWLFHHEETARKKYDSMASTARTVSKYLQQAFKVDEIQPKDLSAKVRDNQLGYLTQAGMEIVPTPQIDMDRLINMAVRRERPFEGEDKGFRDALIVFTIADHAKKFNGDYVLVVAEDHVFGTDEVLNQWRGAGVEPLVAKTLDEAVVMIDNLVSEAVKKYHDHESARIREFLFTQQDAIFEHVLKNGEVSESFVRGGGVLGLGTQDFYGTLQAVKQVRPLEIAKASRGHVTRRAEEEGGRIPVTFDVKVAFDIVVSSFTLEDFTSQKLGLKGPVDLRDRVPTFLNRQTVEQDVTVERNITVEASVLEDSQGKFSDLRIQKILTY